MRKNVKIAVLAAALLSASGTAFGLQMNPTNEAKTHAGNVNPDAMAQRVQAEVLLGQQATDELSKVLQLILKNGVNNVIAAMSNDKYLIPVVGGDYYSFIVPNANGRQYIYMIDPKNKTAAVRVSDLQTGLWNQAMSDFISPSLKGEREFGPQSTASAPSSSKPIENGTGIKAGDIDRQLREKEEALKRAQREAEQARLEKQRREAEEKKAREEALKRAEEERRRAEEARRRAEEEARRRAEEERRRQEELRRRAEAERKRRTDAVLAERRRADAEAEAAQQKAEAEAARRLAEAEAAARKRAEAEIAIARQLAETERAAAAKKARDRKQAVKVESERELEALKNESVENLAQGGGARTPAPANRPNGKSKSEVNSQFNELLRRRGRR